MKRSIIQQLIAWKSNSKRKPLILMGPRQVGKTYILQKFADDQYTKTVYLNFEQNSSYQSLFTSGLAPQRIIEAIAIELNVTILPGKTLVIFDEIQECPDALNSLKYFYEQANQYHICAAGSLLGVTLAKSTGFPVGKVDFLHLYPLDFIEFLEAIEQSQLKNYITTIDSIQPLPDNLHDKLLYYFKIYLSIGGMPETIAEYLDSHDLTKVRKIQQAILTAYQLDFAKHTPNNTIMKIHQIWNAIPSQLAKENKKFIYSIIRKGARAKEFETAIEWLHQAGLIYKVTNISAPKIPLQAYKKFDCFKIYLADVGLLAAMSQLPISAIINRNPLFQEQYGTYIENYIAQTLARHQFDLCYWTSAGKAEIDFILQIDDGIHPLEVKSGYSNKKKSLRSYCDKYQPKIAIRCSPKNLKQDGQIINCPLYLLSEIKALCKLASTDR